MKTASDAAATIFRLGRSRGRGNAKALHSEQGKPAVTDDYGAYDFFADDQALCWAHPKRKFSDLARSTSLSDKRRKHCAGFYERFCALLNDVKAVVRVRTTRRSIQKQRNNSVKGLHYCAPRSCRSEKARNAQGNVLERMEAYLLCVRLPHIPMTNNKAERALRPLVIKRKLSYGSKRRRGGRHKHPPLRLHDAATPASGELLRGISGNLRKMASRIGCRVSEQLHAVCLTKNDLYVINNSSCETDQTPRPLTFPENSNNAF